MSTSCVPATLRLPLHCIPPHLEEGMLASRHGASASATKNAYICLSCRLKTQQKRRYRDRAGQAIQQVENNGQDQEDVIARGRKRADHSLKTTGNAVKNQTPRQKEARPMSLEEAMRGANLNSNARSKKTSRISPKIRNVEVAPALSIPSVPSRPDPLIQHVDSKRPSLIRGVDSDRTSFVTNYTSKYEFGGLVKKILSAEKDVGTQSRDEVLLTSVPGREECLQKSTPPNLKPTDHSAVIRRRRASVRNTTTNLEAQDTAGHKETRRARRLRMLKVKSPKLRIITRTSSSSERSLINYRADIWFKRQRRTKEPTRSVPARGVGRAMEDQIDKHLLAVDRLDAARYEPIQTAENGSMSNEGQESRSWRTSRLQPEQPILTKNSPPRPSTSIVDLSDDVLRKSFSSRSSDFLGSAVWQTLDLSRLASEPYRAGRLHARAFHTAVRDRQQAAAPAMNHEPPSYLPIASSDQPTASPEKPDGIRAQLRQWQELHGHKDPMPDIPQNDDVVSSDDPVNNLTRLPDENAMRKQSQQDIGENDEHATWSNVDKEGYDGSQDDHRYLSPGDLVEIDYMKSERESVLAVYVQSIKGVGLQGQFFTMQGRWMHLGEKSVQYSIPNWVSPDKIKPLLPYLPDAESAADYQSLMDKAYVEDLSVPRHVAAPLVQQMVDFYKESQDIYRRHATALDNAHDILSHDTDLRYGSLMSAATTLLQIPANKLPMTALFTVRKALGNGGFAFNIDRRSHRITGYMQIRSKEQVRMVDNVRNWVRQWQDDLAYTSALNEKQLRTHKTSKGARVLHGFLEKAKAIVEQNRQNRQPTSARNVGPSKVRLPITPETDCVKVITEVRFTDDEIEIVRFIELWSCSQMFTGLPRIESLPPLILHAMGLYDDLSMAGGFLFLQELGAIMPYENKIRFDQHLLLPSSQHSKPLQNLMTSLITMRNSHNFVDSMADLRHDWQNLPVFCIDSADAHEIDDGVSIEPAGVGADGRALHWAHVHVANPTAFFSRDHPLAKMARHMGESIYMPERTYMMLPRWATQRYFSLESGRPCMTFSAKLDEDGNTLETKITPGIIRNVISLTPDDIDKVLGETTSDQYPELTLTVGGTPPPAQRSRSSKTNAKKQHRGFDVGDLRTLKFLAEKRAEKRRRAGGLFFDSNKPEVSVWQSYNRQGLSWDHPWRQGIRTVEGDPVIQMKTRGLVNWFAAANAGGRGLVQELMLLAGETAAAWCSARQIPIIYRGTVRDSRKMDPQRFWEEQVEPHVKDGATMPLHLGIQYIQTQGYTALRTSPLPHRVLGLPAYAKVTSPLRRYGDMIHHWQIEAALRHEAETGRSLYAEKSSKPDRSFLPFSGPVLDTIMLGLQPREAIITRSKAYAEHFWIVMLMFRKCMFGEDGHLPFLPDTHFYPDKPQPVSLVGPPKASAGTAANDLRPLRFFIHTSDASLSTGKSAYGMLMELNVAATMGQLQGEALGETPRNGDVWEVYIDEIDVYRRSVYVKPVRLVGREGAGLL